MIVEHHIIGSLIDGFLHRLLLGCYLDWRLRLGLGLREEHPGDTRDEQRRETGCCQIKRSTHAHLAGLDGALGELLHQLRRKCIEIALGNLVGIATAYSFFYVLFFIHLFI